MTLLCHGATLDCVERRTFASFVAMLALLAPTAPARVRAQSSEHDRVVAELRGAGHAFSAEQLEEAERALASGEMDVFHRIREANFCSVAVAPDLAHGCRYLTGLEASRSHAPSPARPPTSRGSSITPSHPSAPSARSGGPIVVATTLSSWPGCAHIMDSPVGWNDRMATNCARAFEQTCVDATGSTRDSFRAAAELVLESSQSGRDFPVAWRGAERCAAILSAPDRLAQLVRARAHAWIDAQRYDLVSVCLDECTAPLQQELAALEHGEGYAQRVRARIATLAGRAQTVEDGTPLDTLLTDLANVHTFCAGHAGALGDVRGALDGETDAVVTTLRGRFTSGLVAELEGDVARAESSLTTAETGGDAEVRSAAASTAGQVLHETRSRLEDRRALLGGLAGQYVTQLDALDTRLSTATTAIEAALDREQQIDSLHSQYCSDVNGIQTLEELPATMLRHGERMTAEDRRRQTAALAIVRERQRTTIASLRTLGVTASTLACCPGGFARTEADGCE